MSLVIVAWPMIERIMALKKADRLLPRPKQPLALVLTPTRELAHQVMCAAPLHATRKRAGLAAPSSDEK